jgi:hypothetical protein
MLLCLLLISACNNREDILLPPNLSAAEYLEGNKIESYANYLVKSANDDSYFLLDKLAIADSLLNYGDVIDFRRVQSLSARDSLAVQDNAVARSKTYHLRISRNGQQLNLIGRIPLGQVYTELTTCEAPYIVNFAYYLQATEVQLTYYGSNRAYFPLFSTGEFGVYDIPATENASITFNTNTAVHAMLIGTNGKRLAVNFPASYTGAAGQITLSMGGSLSLAEQNTLQGFFPDAAISTSVISMQTATSVGTAIAELWYKDGSKSFFSEQWVCLAPPVAYSWQSTNDDTQANNWWQDSTGLYSFVAGSGKYFLLNPLDAQSDIEIPLDGTYNQVFLQQLWFDLQEINLPNTVMKVIPNPYTFGTIASYFSGKPFITHAGRKDFNIQFYEAGNPIRELPNDAWLEFGFRASLPLAGTERLFSCIREADEDIITYKTPSDTYDAQHFSRTGSYIYTGINSSATYIYGGFSEDQNEQIFPYLKSKQYIQTSKATVGWSSSVKSDYEELRVKLTPTLPSHPWLNGEPLQLTDKQAVAECYFYNANVVQSTLPAGFNLSIPYSGTADKLLLYNNLSYPRLKLYHESTAYEGDTFLLTDGSLSIYPEYPGTLIGASVTYPNPMSLRTYPTMTFVLDELRLYTYGNAAAGTSAVFSINKTAAPADPFNILTSQYTLSQTSPAYTVTTAEEADYDTFQPMLFFKRSRSRNLLFYERTGTPYRLYSYTESSSYSPWNFMIDGAYNGISLSYNGTYASYSEAAVHSNVTHTVKGFGQDIYLSLYQAQFVLPSYFMEGAVPQNTVLELKKLSSLPGTTDLLSAYQLQFTQPNGMPIYPDFYNVIGAPQEPYIYLPISDVSAISSARLFYRNQFGQITELNRVQSFGDNYAEEYTVFGNCFICTVPNTGIFYITR